MEDISSSFRNKGRGEQDIEWHLLKDKEREKDRENEGGGRKKKGHVSERGKIQSHSLRDRLCLILYPAGTGLNQILLILDRVLASLAGELVSLPQLNVRPHMVNDCFVHRSIKGLFIKSPFASSKIPLLSSLFTHPKRWQSLAAFPFQFNVFGFPFLSFFVGVR